MSPNVAIALGFFIGTIVGGLFVYLFLSSRQKESNVLEADKLLALFIQNQANFNAGKLTAEQFEQENERLLQQRKDVPKIITASFEDLQSNIPRSSIIKEKDNRKSIKSDLNALRKIQEKDND